MNVDEKGILNAKLFDGRKTYLEHKEKEIKFTQILVIPNLTCSLRCKYCAAGNQYAERKEFDPYVTVKEFDKLLSVCRTKQVNIQGGEVFLHRQLPVFFELFAKMENLHKAESVAVFTNATVIPTDESLQEYAKISLPKKLIISDYNLPSVKTAKFIEKIEKWNLDYVVLPEDHYWFHPGSPQKEIGYTDEELKEILKRCTKFCRAPKLIDGRFFACGQNGYALYKVLHDFVDIRNCPQDELKEKIWTHVMEAESYDICRYCRGQFDGCEKISVAEQM